LNDRTFVISRDNKPGLFANYAIRRYAPILDGRQRTIESVNLLIEYTHKKLSVPWKIIVRICIDAFSAPDVGLDASDVAHILFVNVMTASHSTIPMQA
jgi:hypothetical protein